MHSPQIGIKIDSFEFPLFIQMRGEYRDLLSEYKNVKTEYNQLKLKHTELKGDMADCRDQLNKLDIQNAKLTNKCEVGILQMKQ